MRDVTIQVSGKTLERTLMVAVAIALVIAFFSFDLVRLFRPKYEIEVFAPEINGMGVGALVTLDGMPVGKVNKIQLARQPADPGRRLEISLQIEKRYQSMIPASSSASLSTEGLLGRRFVNIQREFSGPPINPGGEIRLIPEKEFDWVKVIEALQNTAKLTNCENAQKNAPADKSSIKRNGPSAAH